MNEFNVEKKEEVLTNEDNTVVKQETIAETNKPGQIKWKFFAMGIAALVVLVGVMGIAYTVWAVKDASESPFVLKVAEVLNLPVARVNSAVIPYYTYIEDVQTLNEFYKKAPEGVFPPTTEQAISDQVLSRLIVNSLVKDIARENKLFVTAEDIQEAKNNIFAQYNSEEEVKTELQMQYGWSIETYINKILKPLILERKVTDAFVAGEIAANEAGYEAEDEIKASHILFRTSDDEGNPIENLDEVKKQAEEVMERAKNGEDFAELASEFGSDSTKDMGGDLGWFGRGMMVPEFEEAAFATEAGQVHNGLVETQFGYHVVKVIEQRKARNFGLYLNDKIKQAKVEILVKKVHDPLEEFRKLQDEGQV